MRPLALLADFVIVPVSRCLSCSLDLPEDHDCAQSRPEEISNA